MSKTDRLLDATSAVVHDTKSSVGALRLAVTTLLEEAGEGREFEASMLTRAEAETRRLAAALNCLTPLIAALADDSPPSAVDVAGALRRAGAAASKSGVAAKTPTRGAVEIMARGATVEAVLGCLLVLAAGDGAAVVGRVQVEGGQVVVALDSGKEPVRRTRLTAALIDALGAVPVRPDGPLAFAWPEVA